MRSTSPNWSTPSPPTGPTLRSMRTTKRTCCSPPGKHRRAQRCCQLALHLELLQHPLGRPRDRRHCLRGSVRPRRTADPFLPDLRHAHVRARRHQRHVARPGSRRAAGEHLTPPDHGHRAGTDHHLPVARSPAPRRVRLEFTADGHLCRGSHRRGASSRGPEGVRPIFIQTYAGTEQAYVSACARTSIGSTTSDGPPGSRRPAGRCSTCS